MKRTSEIAYKVLFKSRKGHLLSAIPITNGSCVHYKTRKLNRPNKGHNNFLFIFKDIYAARHFAIWSSWEPARVYRVRAYNVRNRAIGVDGQEYIADNQGDFPEGTAFCSSLRLLKLEKKFVKKTT